MTNINFTELNEKIWASGARREDLVQRVANAVRGQIVSGELKGGTKLIPEAEFAKELGISRPSLREAIRILAREGLIVVKHGVGTFISGETKPMLGSLELMRSMTDLIKAAGGEPHSVDLTIELIDPAAEVREALDLGPDDQIAEIYRVRLTDDQPFVVSHEFLLLDSQKRTLDRLRGFNGGSLYEFLRTELGLVISHSKLNMAAVAAETSMAKVLGLPRKAPLLAMREIHYDFSGRPVLYSINYHNTEVVEFTSMRSGVTA
ncbi:GntR family transcriptional regulator [Rhizobium johnstonii]|uniref:GntR family transcriptional regulator n=1 Tax=Rhizobium TaxID=379 RepID=UPI0013EF5AFA|nr:GntR family transcriptional regulator [Rhizobium leguminosarum]